MAIPPETLEAMKNSGLMVQVLEGDVAIMLSGYTQPIDKSELLSSINGLMLVEKSLL